MVRTAVSRGKKDGCKQKNKNFKSGGGGNNKNGGKQFKYGGNGKNKEGNGKKKQELKFDAEQKANKNGSKFKYSGEHKGKASAKALGGLSRGHGEAFIRGRNFSTSRGSGYRRRYHDRWVTFVPLTALAAILIGSDRYYPYVYIDAPADYCDGFTEDGCEMRWREVETIDGYSVCQCVAYCPWGD